MCPSSQHKQGKMLSGAHTRRAGSKTTTTTTTCYSLPVVFTLVAASAALANVSGFLLQRGKMKSMVYEVEEQVNELQRENNRRVDEVEKLEKSFAEYKKREEERADLVHDEITKMMIEKASVRRVRELQREHAEDWHELETEQKNAKERLDELERILALRLATAGSENPE